MSNDPILNSAMKKHPRGQVRVYDETGKRIAGTSCGGYLREYEDARKPRVIETAAELDALPVGSVVLDKDGAANQKDGIGDWFDARGDSSAPSYLMKHFGPVTVLHEATR